MGREATSKPNMEDGTIASPDEAGLCPFPPVFSPQDMITILSLSGPPRIQMEAGRATQPVGDCLCNFEFAGLTAPGANTCQVVAVGFRWAENFSALL